MLDDSGWWSFGNDFVRNVVIFGVDNSFSSHNDIRKNNFLVLGKALTDDINGRIGTAEKTFSINFSKAKAKYCLSLHYNSDISSLFVNRKKNCKFKANNKNINFPTLLCLGRISNTVDFIESIELSFRENVHVFSVDYILVKYNIK